MGWGGGGGEYFMKTFPFSMHFNSKNGQLYQNFGFNCISFGKKKIITNVESLEVHCNKIMQFTETLFSIIL